MCRIEESGCALHNEGRIVVRGMIISGDSSVWGGDEAHNTFMRMARVASSATFEFREARRTGKMETKSGRVG
jgi:hypothetical protein